MKLQFLDEHNNKYIVTRSMEARILKAKLDLKTIDGTISIVQPDGKVVLSFKCPILWPLIFDLSFYFYVYSSRAIRTKSLTWTLLSAIHLEFPKLCLTMYCSVTRKTRIGWLNILENPKHKSLQNNPFLFKCMQAIRWSQESKGQIWWYFQHY